MSTVKITAVVSTNKVGSEVKNVYETPITHEEWAEMDEGEREAVLQDYLDNHLSAAMDCAVWAD